MAPLRASSRRSGYCPAPRASTGVEEDIVDASSHTRCGRVRRIVVGWRRFEWNSFTRPGWATASNRNTILQKGGRAICLVYWRLPAYKANRRPYKDLRRPYKDLRRAYKDLRRPRKANRRPYKADRRPCKGVWRGRGGVWRDCEPNWRSPEMVRQTSNKY